MANMRCTVKFFLDQVTCPGTLHLPDRNPVYLTIFLFGRFQRSPHVYPSFPMGFTTKIKFQRLFTNAKTPEQVLEILEDETILIELRQHTKGLKGGRILAEFEETTRSFLFPSQSYIPKRNHLKRDVLLTRTDNFPIGKGLDPQFSFRTKTYIEEGPFIHSIRDDISLSRQIPPSEVSPECNIRDRSILSNKEKRKKSSPRLHNVHINEPEGNNTGSDDTESVQASVHCICDCPSLDDDPATLDYWLETWNKKKKKKSKVKPFRTGKAPKQLLSKREFSDSFKKEKHFGRKGICNYCAVPLPSCVLCNAYKSVYGPTSFITHRFKKENKTKERRIKRYCREKLDSVSESPGKGKSSGQTYDSSKYYTPNQIGKHRIDRSILKADGNLKPITKSNRSYSVSRYSGDDNDFRNNIETYNNTALPPRSSIKASKMNPLLVEERHVKSVPPKSKTSRLFNSHISRAHSEEELYALESDRIHERIKNLMKKNNSVLQYDLSSSESITDDDYEIQDESLSPDSSLEDSPTYGLTRMNLPTKSVVEPLASENKWSTRSGKNNDLTHRDILDSRLKAIYADLYQKTLNNT